MRSAALSLGLAFLLLSPSSPAAARSRCARTVVFTLPGVTWGLVARERPPELLEAMSQGAAGSMSVRTNDDRTTLGSAFTTMGAGSRADGGGEVKVPLRPARRSGATSGSRRSRS